MAVAGGDITSGDVATMNYVNSDNSNSEIEALKQQMGAMQTKIGELENRKVVVPAVPVQTSIPAPKSKGIEVKSHVPVLDFSGEHYFGFVNKKTGNADRTNKFETRRNYFQAKGYFKEDPKDYVRLTLDTYGTKGDTGRSDVTLKYAYLYLDNVLPNTGVELGQVHRPWIDYEEHNGWNFRSISKTLVEADNGAHLTNSADRGVDFKTKTPYFSSELGLFNGEGYHGNEDGTGLSKEWRLTGHLLGTGKQKAKKSLTYANLSFFGQQNSKLTSTANADLNWMGVHAVYNQPAFLVATEYIKVSDGVASKKGKGYSVNGEYRITPKWNTLARYDYFDLDNNLGEKKRAIAGVAYEYNHNVEFIANYLKEGGSNLGAQKKSNAAMLTAEVKW